MTRKKSTIAPAYFEDKYKSDIDPWRFRSSEYEREKYTSTIDALGKPLFERGLEVGCSIGVLTGLLAPRCKTLVAVDASETAITEARSRGAPNVTFDVAAVPDRFPAGVFDLIVLSEVLYYFSRTDLQRVAASCVNAIAPDGELLLCHWLGETNYPLTGEEASDFFATAIFKKMPVRKILRDDMYRLERFSLA